MKKLILSGVAVCVLAAATPAVAQPMPVFNWSGFYIGGHVGGVWAAKEWSTANGPFAEHTATGVLGGGQVGYDYQTGAWVLGVEGQGSWANVSGNSIEFRFAGAENFRARSEIDFLATLTGRAGYAWGRTLLYVKGGVAWVNENFTETFIPNPALVTTARDSRTGWVVGAGLEQALAANWSIKFEYNYMDFGKRRLTFTGTQPGQPFFNDIDQTVHTLMLGLNYRFRG